MLDLGQGRSKELEHLVSQNIRKCSKTDKGIPNTQTNYLKEVL